MRKTYCYYCADPKQPIQGKQYGDTFTGPQCVNCPCSLIEVGSTVKPVILNTGRWD